MAIEYSTLTTANVNELLTVPNGMSYAITTIIVCNTYSPDPSNPDLGEANFDLHLVTASEVTAALGVVADAIADRNRVINNLNLKAGESYSFDSEKLILEAGDVVAIVATLSDNLSATVSYLEI